MNENTVRTQQAHDLGGQVTWTAMVWDAEREIIAELRGFATEAEAEAAGSAYREPDPEAQTECPRAANRPETSHYAPHCQSAFCRAERANRDAAAVARFITEAQRPGFEVRSRSECGGVLVLYRFDATSPTGVFATNTIRDTRENRAALAAVGVAPHLGAY